MIVMWTTVTSFMSMFTSILNSVLPYYHSPTNKLKGLLPKNIHSLIAKKHRLQKKITDVESLETYQETCRSIGATMKQHKSCHDLNLIKYPNRAAFYKYNNRALGQQQQPFQLNNATGQVISVETAAADTLCAEIAKNFLPLSFDTQLWQLKSVPLT